MEFDVIVVGAGAVGGSIAYELSSRGLNVCRVGETDRANAASRAAGAMNGCFGEVTSGLLASDFGRLKLDMDRQAQQLWPSWAERLATSSGNATSRDLPDQPGKNDVRRCTVECIQADASGKSGTLWCLSFICAVLGAQCIAGDFSQDR